MTFEKIAKQFTLQDVRRLVSEFYPETVDYLLVYEDTYSILQEENKYIDHKLTVRIEDGEVSLFMLSGKESLYYLLSGVAKSVIHYMTMELHRDEEILIRILHEIVFKGYKESERQAILNKNSKD